MNVTTAFRSLAAFNLVKGRTLGQLDADMLTKLAAAFNLNIPSDTLKGLEALLKSSESTPVDEWLMKPGTLDLLKKVASAGKNVRSHVLVCPHCQEAIGQVYEPTPHELIEEARANQNP